MSDDPAVPADDPRLAAFVGAGWESHYRRSFAAIGASRSPLRGCWNWAAALVPFWSAARRLWLYQVFVPVLWGGLLFAQVNAGVPWLPAALAGLVIVAAIKGWWADRWLLADALLAIDAGPPEGADDDAALARVAKRGGVSVVRAAGFAAVLVVLALLMDLPAAFDDPRARARIALMKCELRDVADAEAAFYGDHHTYSADLGRDPAASGPGRTRPVCRLGDREPPQVTVRIVAATGTGWSAAATHAALPHARCAIFGGDATPVAPATVPGEPACVR